ncbi:Protein phosphatase PP2A regulatory subunit B, partial [Rhizophlyctis rosea]
MNGRMIGNKPIYVALAQRKEVRRAQLSAQMQQRNQQLRVQQGMPGVGYPAAPPMFYPPMMPGGPRPGFYPNQAMRPRWGPQQGVPQGAPMQPGQAGIPPPGAYPAQPGQIPQQFN